MLYGSNKVHKYLLNSFFFFFFPGNNFVLQTLSSRQTALQEPAVVGKMVTIALDQRKNCCCNTKPPKCRVWPLPFVRCLTWHSNESKQIYYSYKHEIRKWLWKLFPVLCLPVSFLLLPFPSLSSLLVFFLHKRNENVQSFFPLSFIILIPV